MNKIPVVHQKANKHLHKITLVLYSADMQTGTFPNAELKGTPYTTSQQHSSVQSYRMQKALACQSGHRATGSQMCCLTTTSYISLMKTSLQQKAKLCAHGKMNLVSKELGLQTNQRGHVKPAVISLSLILECQYWIRVPGLPRMATVVTAMPVPTYMRVASERGRSCKKPPRGPAFSKIKFDWGQ